jgi:hypothetical protein
LPTVTDLRARRLEVTREAVRELGDRFSLVEVTESLADRVIEALSGSSLRGKRVTVRRERP